jgi:predicted RNA-binding Zn ribbon-like protein
MTASNLTKLAERLRVKFIGGFLCLDFVNTVSGRDATGAVIRDKIGSYDDLLGWGRLAGSLDAGCARSLAGLADDRPREAVAILERAIRLREALYRIFRSGIQGRRPAELDADVLRVELAVARANQRLTASGKHFVWTFTERPESLDQVLWPVSLSAAELLTSDDLARVRQCGGADCGWLFLDASRNRRRRWCDMQDCGNRAKVRRYRAKHSTADLP